MKKILIATAVGMLVAGHVAAQESPWLVRARVVQVNQTNHDSTGLDLKVADKTIPEFDVSYFFGGFKHEVQHGLTRRETPRGAS